MTKATPHGPERVDLSNEQGEHAVLALTWFGRENETWLLTEYDPEKPASERILDGSGSPVSGADEPTSPPPRDHELPTEGSPLVPGSPQSAPQGDGHTPPESSRSSVTEASTAPAALGELPKGAEAKFQSLLAAGLEDSRATPGRFD
jgi:hypothetical protein